MFILLLGILIELFSTFPADAGQPPPVLPMVQQTCSQCHALKVAGDCVAGGCQTVRVFPTRPRQWIAFVNWIRNYVGCPMTDAQQEAITKELNEHYPVPVTPLSWKEDPPLPKGGRVTALLAVKQTRYVGTDRGLILQFAGSGPWRTVAKVGPMTVSAMTEFRGTLYAATQLPRGEIWTSPDGRQWKKAADLTELSGGLLSLEVVDRQLYAGTAKGGVLRSLDGVSWTAMPVIATGMGSAWVRVVQGYGGFLYAGLALGDLFRTQSGQPWSKATFPQPPGRSSAGINTAAVFPGGLFIGPTTRAEVWKTDTVHWQRIFNAVPGQQGGTVEALAATHGALYAAMTLPDETGHLYRTRNGAFWEEVIPPLRTGRIKKLAGLSGRLIAAVQDGERIRIFEVPEAAPASRQGEQVVYSAPGTQEHPSIASDGKNLFMIFHTQEEGSTSIIYDVYGGLLNLEGKPIGEFPIKISTERDSQAWSNLAFGGGEYFAVWTDSRHHGFEVYGARIDTKGRVMDPDGIAVAPGPGDREFAETVWDGRSFLTVWHQTQGPQNSGGYDIYGRRMKPDGTFLETKPFPIASAPRDQTFAQVASSGRESLVVWTDRRRGEEDIFAARVDRSGKVLDPEGIPVTTASNNQNYPSVGWNGRDFLAAWVDQRESAIRAARISPDGKILDAEGIVVSEEPVVHSFPDVACHEGGPCLVIWEQTSPVPGERDVRAARIDLEGRLLDPKPVAVSVYPGQQRFSTAYPLPDRKGFLAAWEDFPIWDTGDIYDKIVTFRR